MWILGKSGFKVGHLTPSFENGGSRDPYVEYASFSNLSKLEWIAFWSLYFSVSVLKLNVKLDMSETSVIWVEFM